DTAHVRLDPDLQEMDRALARGIELAVHHAAARAHTLHVAGTHHRAAADRVLVLQFAIENVTDDLHIAMAVRAEAGAGRDPVLVDDAQWPELDVLRVEVIGEGKRVIRLEPAVVGIAALVTASDVLH